MMYKCKLIYIYIHRYIHVFFIKSICILNCWWRGVLSLRSLLSFICDHHLLVGKCNCTLTRCFIFRLFSRRAMRWNVNIFCSSAAFAHAVFVATKISFSFHKHHTFPFYFPTLPLILQMSLGQAQDFFHLSYRSFAFVS